MVGLVDPETLKPGDLVGVNKVGFSGICCAFLVPTPSLVTGLVPGSGHPPLRVRQSRQGDGGRRQADRAVLRHRRAGQTDSGAGGGCGAAHDAQGQVKLSTIVL